VWRNAPELLGEARRRLFRALTPEQELRFGLGG
jgi:hypothetical protein